MNSTTYSPVPRARKQLARFVNSSNRWSTKVREAMAAGTYPNGRGPSKAAKYHAYDAAETIRLHLNLDVPRASTFADLETILHLSRGDA